MPNEIVYYDSNEAGAPVLNNAAGSLIGLLDACLINGFNSKTVTSIVVVAGIATATISTHGYAVGPGRMIDIAGVTGGPTGFALLNGRKKVLSAPSANTITFDAAGVSAGTATGTMTSRKSPLGWSKQYSGTNLAMYKRTDIQANAMMLRVADTAADPLAARVLMVEAATAISTYTGPVPTNAQVSGGGYWTKGANDASAKDWCLVGDGRTFHLFMPEQSYAYSTYAALPHMAFGDLDGFKPGDSYDSFLVSGTSTSSFQGVNIGAHLGTNPTAFTVMLARRSDQIALAVPALAMAVGTVSYNGTAGPKWPSPIGNGLVIQKPILMFEAYTEFNNPVRGIIPGMVAPLGLVGNGSGLQPLNRVVITNPIGFTGDLLCVGIVAGGNFGLMMLDLTGPWQ